MKNPKNGGGDERGRREPAVLLTRDITGTLSSPGVDSSSGPSQPGALGPVVTKALQDVLGWKITGDAKGFMNALNRSFDLKEFEGVVQATWIPRGIAVQDDLSGGVAGAQASIYAMARTMLDQTLPLLDGLYPLKPDADEEYITVARELVANQLRKLVAQLKSPGGPLVMQVNQYFHMLLAVRIDMQGDVSQPRHDPDKIEGTLGALRRQMGLRAIKHHDNTEKCYVNNVDDEQNVTNFRVIVDYVYAIFNAWQGSINFFKSLTPESKKVNFLGTELVWISRQLSVVSEVVDEIRFLLDSDLVGPGERETLWLHAMTLKDQPDVHMPDLTLESLLSWIQTFVRNEAPDIIRNGGRYGIGVDFAGMVAELETYAEGLLEHAPHVTELRSERLHPSLHKLVQQLRQLKHRAASVGDSNLLA
jgi:hypothetical protein